MSVAQQTRPTQSQWDARAIELAEAAHLTGTARLLSENELHSFYGVRKSGPAGEYLVRVERIGGHVLHVRCDCLAGQHGKACKHAGATLYALRLREQAISQPDTDPLASWRRGGAWGDEPRGSVAICREARDW